MPTSIVQMRNKITTVNNIKEKKTVRAENALVLIELLVVIVILTLMLPLASLALTGGFTKQKFKKQAYKFINVLKMAQDAAAESERRYTIRLDLFEQTYELRELSSLDFDELVDYEPIIVQGQFTEDCILYYVQFDDYESTQDTGGDPTIAWLLAGHNGWQYGAKIVLLDSDGDEYSIVLNRLSRAINLEQGDVGLLVPKYKYEVLF